NGHAASALTSALAREDPLAARVVEAAGEDVVAVTKFLAGRVLVPRSPRHRPAFPGEVDRRSLAVLRLVEVERAAEHRAGARAPAHGAVAPREPGAVRERASKDLVGGG